MDGTNLGDTMLLQPYLYLCLGLTCAIEEALLDGANPVPDSYFTASSTTSATLGAPAARMSVSYCWVAADAEINANPPTSYLQVSTSVLNRTSNYL